MSAVPPSSHFTSALSRSLPSWFWTRLKKKKKICKRNISCNGRQEHVCKHTHAYTQNSEVHMDINTRIKNTQIQAHTVTHTYTHKYFLRNTNEHTHACKYHSRKYDSSDSRTTTNDSHARTYIHTSQETRTHRHPCVLSRPRGHTCTHTCTHTE